MSSVTYSSASLQQVAVALSEEIRRLSLMVDEFCNL